MSHSLLSSPICTYIAGTTGSPGDRVFLVVLD